MNNEAKSACLAVWVLVCGSGLTFAESGDGADPFFRPRPELYECEESIERPAAPPRRRLVEDVGSDFKGLFTRRENLYVVAGGLAAAWGARGLDQHLAESRLNSELFEETGLDSFFEAGEIAGGSLVQVSAAFATYGLGKLFDRPGLAEIGRDLARAQIVTGAVTFGMKMSVGRSRPDGSNSRSFPSGHASGTFATAAVLHRRYGWKAGIPAYTVAGYVAASRLNENRHYLSDVVFGAALGILVGRSVTMEVAGERWVLGPLFVPGGAGIQLSLAPSRRSW